MDCIYLARISLSVVTSKNGRWPLERSPVRTVRYATRRLSGIGWSISAIILRKTCFAIATCIFGVETQISYSSTELSPAYILSGDCSMSVTHRSKNKDNSLLAPSLYSTSLGTILSSTSPINRPAFGYNF